MKKNKFTTKSIIGVVGFILLGLLAFFVGYTDINWLPFLTIVDLFVLVIVFIACINFLAFKRWRFLLFSLSAFIVALGLMCLIVFVLDDHSDNVIPTIFARILTTFRNARSVIFVTLAFLIVGQAILGLMWKPAQKWGLLVFYMLLGAIIAVVGQVVDYVTRQDVARHATEAVGISFGDYGLSDSLHDHAESYQENNKPDEPRLNDGYRAVSKYGVGISRHDRIKSYRNKEK